jgi:hypothetical protein
VLGKNRPKCSPKTFFVKINAITVENVAQKFWATSVIFKKTAQGKKSPKGRENSPISVTLPQKIKLLSFRFFLSSAGAEKSN